MEKRHAIIVIKNEEGKYLQYFDDIWNCYLFLNCKISNENDFDNIKNEINNKFNINLKDIELVMDKIHSKFSEKDKIVKEYHHYFYNAVMNDSNFNNSNNFKYFSYGELLTNKRIQEVNSDIVSFIKEIN